MKRMLLVLLFVTANGFAQTGNGGLTGIVEDPTKALIPGVSIVATNVQTGVATAVVTNESGAYNIPSLLPGVYKLTAELPGFRTVTFNNIELGTNETKRFNFTLEVGGVATSVDVTIDATSLLTTSSATIGEVLPEYKVRDLPLVGSDVLDLIAVLGGARVSAAGGDVTTFAGISAGYVNTTVNGQSVQDGRYQAGIYSTVRVNPDLVSEIRLVLTPVDAEMGRGNGQVQIQTRSGTNQFRGSAVWNGRNSAFEARSWFDNRTVPRPTRDWRNQHQATISYGGPIVKNKTFFFALFDGQNTRLRQSVNGLVLTDCARNGIFRYFPDWNNGNINQVTPTLPTTSGNAATPVVDPLGNAKPPATARNGAPYTGALQYVSVFGRVQNVPARPDCSDAVVTPNTAWDSNRTISDTTGFVSKIMGLMPRPNSFDTGDGLNTAGFRWARARKGDDEVSGGTQDDTERKQIDVRIDHNFNSRHKLSGNVSYEWDFADNSGPAWPGGFWGTIYRRPQVYTANFVSTLRPTLVNEARFGIRYNDGKQYEALDEPKTGKAAREFMPTVNGLPLIVGLGAGMGTSSVNFQSSILSFGDFTRGNITELWTYADTMSWTKGHHGFRFGAEVRRSKSAGWSNLNLIPHATGGSGGTTGQIPLPNFMNNPAIPNLLASNNTTMGNLLNFLSGSIGTLNQLYWLQYGNRLDKYEDLRTEKNRSTDYRQHEFAGFFKDDWKLTSDVTLNLGVRYEYYGSPFEAHGLTPAPVGGAFAAFGYSGRSFEDWLKPGKRGEPLSFEMVGPGSPNPGKSLWKADRNNFGPAVGFAWQVPWFGKGKTTVRGGYQVTFQGGGRTLDFDVNLGYAPGMIFTPNLSPAPNSFVTLADIMKPSACGGAGCLPVPHNIKPMQTIPNEYRATTSGWRGGIYDANYVAPYIQNFTLAVTRSVFRNMTVDVRYIGTRGVKLFGDLPLNLNNFITNGLMEAFDAARYGAESELLDRMFRGINIAGLGYGPVGTVFNGVPQTGAMHLRAFTSTQGNLANGNYAQLANTLNTLNYNTALTGNGSLPVIPLNVQGAVLRQNNFPENFITTNPQFNSLTFKSNLNSSTYHAMQSQFTLRPTLGLSYQGTFTWGKSMGSPPNGGFADPTDRRELGLLFGHRALDFRSNGSFELPFGPGKPLLNGSGWLARVVEKWQTSVIFQMTSGRPNTISAQSMMLQGTGTPVVTPEGVAVFGDFPSHFGKVEWPKDAQAGSYFPKDTFVRVDDPQCARVTALQNLNGSGTGIGRCTLDALARPLPSGKSGVAGQITLPDGRPGVIVLRHPLPGERGTLGLNTMEGPGLWFLDAAMSKTVRISESKSVQFRIDAKNVLNHPTPDDAGLPTCAGLGTNLSLNSASGADFGTIGGKCVAESAARRFQAALRFNF